MMTDWYSTALEIAKAHNVDISDKRWAYSGIGMGYYIQFLAAGHKLEDFAPKHREIIDRAFINGKNPKRILDKNLTLNEIENILDDMYQF